MVTPSYLLLTLALLTLIIGPVMANMAVKVLAQQLQSRSVVNINIDACDARSQNPINPKSVTVPVGGSVNWTNHDSTQPYHEMISGTPKALSNIFDTGQILKGGSHKVVFNEAGTFVYYDSACESFTHPTQHLNGTVTVVEQR